MRRERRMAVNKVFLQGRFVRDPELYTFDNGNKMASFSLAQNRKTKAQDGELTEKASFFDCKTVGTKLAEMIKKHFTQGRQIFVEGLLEQERWVDKVSGKERTKVVVKVTSFEFVDSKSETTTSDSEEEVAIEEETKMLF